MSYKIALGILIAAVVLVFIFTFKGEQSVTIEGKKYTSFQVIPLSKINITEGDFKGDCWEIITHLNSNIDEKNKEIKNSKIALYVLPFSFLLNVLLLWSYLRKEKNGNSM